MTQLVRFEAPPAPSWTTPRKVRHEAQDRWHRAATRTRTTIQMAVLLGVVVVAYNYSLSTLVQNAGLETPLAYVSLVPAIALALAALRARPLRPEPAIHDRQVDYIVGLPLVAGALAANLLLAQPDVGDVLGVADRPPHPSGLRRRCGGHHLRRTGPVAPEARQSATSSSGGPIPTRRSCSGCSTRSRPRRWSRSGRSSRSSRWRSRWRRPTARCSSSRTTGSRSP